MAIINRDKDVTEKMENFSSVQNLTVAASAGQAFYIAQAPYPATLKAVSFAAQSVSGAPQVAIDIVRWSGAGVTTIPYLSTTLVLTATGISTAYQSISLAAPSSTLVQLQAGDVIKVNALFSGGNVAAANCVVTAVLQATQDMKEHFGIIS